MPMSSPEKPVGKAPAEQAVQLHCAVNRTGTGFTPTDVDALLAAHGFECHEHMRTPALLERYAPTQVRSLVGNDWQAITTAQRI